MTYLPPIVAIALLSIAYYTWQPLGGRQRGGRKARILSSANAHAGTFQNQIDTPMNIGPWDALSLLWEQLHDRARRRPARPLEPQAFDAAAFMAASGTRLVWLGHSTVLLRLQGKTILFDPVFSKRVSPFQWIGPKRFDGSLRLRVTDLPPIDAVVISHDHYDHLDYHTIRQLQRRVARFFVPLGVGAHLEHWGIAPAAITELDWWEQGTLDNLTFTCTPARHFSGRRLGDRAKTLWAGWAVAAGNQRIFFSGDSAYGPHFAEIGRRCGPFDLTMVECGQYDRRWANVHMLPEQTVQAAQDLQSRLLVPIHWGAFVLALHPWTEPVERAAAAAATAGIPFATPELAQTLLPAGRRPLPGGRPIRARPADPAEQRRSGRAAARCGHLPAPS